MSLKNIRIAVPSDGPALLRIMEAAVKNLQQRDWFLDDDLDFIMRHIDGPDGYTLKYVVDGVIAGFLIVRYPGISDINLGHYLNLSEEDLLLAAHMESAGVLPEFRGQKIMYQLLSAAIEHEKQSSTKYLFVTVHPDNIYSKNNLISVGFQPIVTLKKYGDWLRTVMYMNLYETVQKEPSIKDQCAF